MLNIRNGPTVRDRDIVTMNTTRDLHMPYASVSFRMMLSDLAKYSVTVSCGFCATAELLVMSLPSQTGRLRHLVFTCSFVCPFVPLFVCFQSYEHDISKTNEPILMQKWLTGQGHEMINFVGSGGGTGYMPLRLHNQYIYILILNIIKCFTWFSLSQI